MKKFLPFLFLVLLYLYTDHSSNIAFLHKPIVSIFLYIIAILFCALILVNVKKEITSKNK